MYQTILQIKIAQYIQNKTKNIDSSEIIRDNKNRISRELLHKFWHSGSASG